MPLSPGRAGGIFSMLVFMSDPLGEWSWRGKVANRSGLDKHTKNLMIGQYISNFSQNRAARIVGWFGHRSVRRISRRPELENEAFCVSCVRRQSRESRATVEPTGGTRGTGRNGDGGKRFDGKAAFTR